MSANPVTDGRAGILALIRRMDAAAAAKDVDAIMEIFAPGVRSFEFDPPLQHRGAEAVRANCERGYAHYPGDFAFDSREVEVLVEGNLAVVSALQRFEGQGADGANTVNWTRATYCFRRIGKAWRIVHQHLSVPVGADGRADFAASPDLDEVAR